MFGVSLRLNSKLNHTSENQSDRHSSQNQSKYVSLSGSGPEKSAGVLMADGSDFFLSGDYVKVNVVKDIQRYDERMI